MTKSSTCTIIICSKCKTVIQKSHTKGDNFKQPWTFRNKRPICLRCIEKLLTKDKDCGIINKRR